MLETSVLAAMGLGGGIIREMVLVVVDDGFLRAPQYGMYHNSCSLAY